jgi:hypothetical protein
MGMVECWEIQLAAISLPIFQDSSIPFACHQSVCSRILLPNQKPPQKEGMAALKDKFVAKTDIYVKHVADLVSVSGFEK